jgi:F-type H+-transporting ATPase subunit a
MNFMDIKDISPDQVVFFQYEFVKLNLTIVFTWAVMALLAVAAWFATKRSTSGRKISAVQNLLEIVATGIRDQIEEIGGKNTEKYVGFIGTLFVFIAACNLLGVVPGYESPTASLSTTAALAICVFVSVPLYGISEKGLLGYLKQYVRPKKGF